MAVNQNLVQYDLNAVHAINRFLWMRLTTDGILSPADYGDRVPIIPRQQVPEFNAVNAPFIVYNWTIPPIGSDWFRASEQIVYLIYSYDARDHRVLLNYMRSLLDRAEGAAGEVNNYVWSIDARYRKFTIHDIRMDMANAPLPIGEENSRMESMITFTVDYVVDLDPTGMRR